MQSATETLTLSPSVLESLKDSVTVSLSSTQMYALFTSQTMSLTGTMTLSVSRFPNQTISPTLVHSQPCNVSDALCVGVSSLGGATNTQAPNAGVSASLPDTASGGSSTPGNFVNVVVGAVIGVGLLILLVLIVCLLLIRRRRKSRHTDKPLSQGPKTINGRAGVEGAGSPESAADTGANYEYAYTNPIHQPRARKNANDELRLADLRSLRFAANRGASKRIKREFSATLSIPVDRRDDGCGDAASSVTRASIDEVVSSPRVGIVAQSFTLSMDAGIVSPISSRRFMGSTPVTQALGSSMTEGASGASHRRLFPPAGGGHLEQSAPRGLSGSRRAVVAVRRKAANPSTALRGATTEVGDAVAPV